MSLVSSSKRHLSVVILLEYNLSCLTNVNYLQISKLIRGRVGHITSTFGIRASFPATVERYYNEFNRGRHLLGEEIRERRSKLVFVLGNIVAVEKLITRGCHVTYCEIGAA